MAKQRALGADTQLLLGFETTYGTSPATGAYKRLAFESIELGAESPLGYQPLLGKGPEAQDPNYDAIDASGRVVVPFDLREIGWWLKALFGDAVTTGTGPYDHVFTTGKDLPSFSLELGHTKLTTPRYQMVSGIKAGSISFDMGRTGLATATIELIGQSEADPNATSVDGTPDETAPQLMYRKRGGIQVGGSNVGDITGGRVTLSNGLEPVPTIRADGLIGGVDETERTAEGSVEVRYGADTTLTDPAEAETPVAMDYLLTVPGAEGYGLTFALPRVFLPRTRQSISGVGGIQSSYDWRGARDATAGHLTQITLKNDVTDYT